MLLAALNELIDWCECTQNELTTKRKSLKPDLSFISKEMNANKVSNNNETECVCEREKKRKERREERGERREERGEDRGRVQEEASVSLASFPLHNFIFFF